MQAVLNVSSFEWKLRVSNFVCKQFWMGEVLNASNFEREQFWMEIENKQLCMQAVLNVSSFEWKQFWKEIKCKQFFIFHSYIKPVQPEKNLFKNLAEGSIFDCEVKKWCVNKKFLASHQIKTRNWRGFVVPTNEKLFLTFFQHKISFKKW